MDSTQRELTYRGSLNLISQALLVCSRQFGFPITVNHGIGAEVGSVYAEFPIERGLCLFYTHKMSDSYVIRLHFKSEKNLADSSDLVKLHIVDAQMRCLVEGPYVGVFLRDPETNDEKRSKKENENGTEETT